MRVEVGTRISRSGGGGGGGGGGGFGRPQKVSDPALNFGSLNTLFLTLQHLL